MENAKRQRLALVGGASLVLAFAVALMLPAPRPLFSGAAMLAAAHEGLAVGGNDSTPARTVAAVIHSLKRDYGAHIVTDEDWVFNNAGGAMGAMKVLHFSLTEYVIIFGTAVGTEGHTGRFYADDYFTMLHGEQWVFTKGVYEKQVFRPGEQNIMRRGVAKQYRLPDSAWALEYAHGNMLSMLPFGLADGLFSTLDFSTLYDTISVATRGVFRELAMGKI